MSLRNETINVILKYGANQKEILLTSEDLDT